MARKNRSELVVPNVPHHLIIRGNNRRRLFSYWTCYSTYLRILEASARALRCAIHACVLMTNHIHLVSTPPSAAALSALMKTVGQRYATYRNRRRAATGKLFEERFDSIPIMTTEYLAWVTAYVELNPERAGLTKDARAYPWSSCGLHTPGDARGPFPAGLWTPSDWWLSLGPDDVSRKRAYSQWLDACRGRSDSPFTREHREAMARTEALNVPYTLRLQRPDGTRARDRTWPYGVQARERG